MERICVYCASNEGVRPEYMESARNIGRQMAGRGLTVVYGGGRTGLMGALADAALQAGGEVIGVMPHALMEREAAHNGLTALHIVDSMHERKAMLADLSDAFVALPGGLGTLEELFETWTWAQLGVHCKPVALLNVLDYWQPLVQLMTNVEKEGFLRGTPHEWLVVESEPTALLDRLHSFTPPQVRRWLRLGDT